MIKTIQTAVVWGIVALAVASAYTKLHPTPPSAFEQCMTLGHVQWPDKDELKLNL